VAVIGVEGVEIRIYRAEEPILTLITDQKGYADTMLEADTYRIEYWFEDRKVGEHEITLEVDSFVIWSFPAILMAVVKKLPLVVKVEGKLGDVMLPLPLITEVEAVITPEFYPSLKLSVLAKPPDVELKPSLTAECIVPAQIFPTNSLSATVKAKLGDVTISQTLVETVAVA